jgi:hypothetical protein
VLVRLEGLDDDAGMGLRLFGGDLGDFFFEVLLLRLGRGLRITRPRLLDRPSKSLQRLPAALRRELFQSQFPRHPACDLAARPTPAVRRRFMEARADPLQQFGLENRWLAAVPAARPPTRRN